jgi:hypothetical protein
VTSVSGFTGRVTRVYPHGDGANITFGCSQETELSHTTSIYACSMAVVEAAGWRSAMWQRNRWTWHPPPATSSRWRTAASKHLTCRPRDVGEARLRKNPANGPETGDTGHYGGRRAQVEALEDTSGRSRLGWSPCCPCWPCRHVANATIEAFGPTGVARSRIHQVQAQADLEQQALSVFRRCPPACRRVAVHHRSAPSQPGRRAPSSRVLREDWRW